MERYLLSGILVLLLCASSSAQVYTLKPTYYSKMTHSGDKEFNDMWFDAVNTVTNKTFTIDIDKKTITVPNEFYPEGKVEPIKEVIREKDSRTIILKMNASKEIGQVWSYYKLGLDEEGQPIELILTERLTGKRFARDTFFDVYTNHLRSLAFYRECTKMKKNMAFQGDADARHKQMDGVYKMASTEEYNTMEMRGGYVYLKQGKGKHAIQHTYKITDIRTTEAKTSIINITCTKDAETYHVIYFKSRAFEPGHTIPLPFFIWYQEKDGLQENMIMMQ